MPVAFYLNSKLPPTQSIILLSSLSLQVYVLVLYSHDAVGGAPCAVPLCSWLAC